MSSVLLTGASGVVGRAAAARLDGEGLIGLVHGDSDPLPAGDRIVCDLRRERLGLDRKVWDELAERTGAIVHSAALTEWGRRPGEYAALNIDGTRHLLELARRADAPVYYVGTSFVHALERGPAERLREDNVVLPYIRSKLAAERLLAESDVPSTVFRPTNLVGDSATGASSRPQIVQALSDWISRGKAPYLPVHPGNLLDVVPVDVLAAVVARAVEARDVGRLYWVTCGDRALTVEEALAIIGDHSREAGRELRLPPVIDPSRGLPMPLAETPATSRSFLKVLLDVSEVTHASGGVLPTSREEIKRRLGVAVAPVGPAYRRSLAYWARQRAEVAGA